MHAKRAKNRGDLMKKLFICEKPSQARDIARVLNARQSGDGFITGPDCIITWCLGHLLKQAPPDDYEDKLKPWRMAVLPVIPNQWKMLPIKKTKKQLDTIKQLLKQTKHVVIATDADREGDVIGRELLDYFKFKGEVERLWLSALDDVSIKKALNDIRSGSSTEKLYQAGLGRQRADWLIGMNLTMATSALFGSFGQGVLSVGRVQTPTLKLVVDRDRDIENFMSKNYFVLRSEFQSANHELFWTTWQPEEEYCDDDNRCLKQEFVDAVAKKTDKKPAKISYFSEQRKKTSPPLCFSLSNLQKIASSQFGLSVKKTLEIAQSLYEKHKATTYPRTDCGYLPESQFGDAKTILPLLKKSNPEYELFIDACELNVQSSTWNDKKITAHHAIIPTLNPNVEINKMSQEERQLYDLICRYYIAQFLGDYEFIQRKVEVLCEDEIFKATSNQLLIKGWKTALLQHKNGIDEDGEDGKNKESKEESESNVPALNKDEAAQHTSSVITVKQTKPPSRYTEGTLISAMKSISKFVENPALKKTLKDSAGIGTEATRANILETLFNRKYVDRKKKQLISTEKGREIIDLLPEVVKNPATTALWEQTLDDISTGESSLDDFIYDQVDALEAMLEQLAELKESGAALKSIPTKTCPACGKPMVQRNGKNGLFWGCSGYPECRAVDNISNKSAKKAKKQKKATTSFVISDKAREKN